MPARPGIPVLIAWMAIGGMGAAPAARAATLTWKGHTWQVTSGGTAGVCSGDPNNVTLDSAGDLHLKISQNNGVWSSSELFTTDRLGFGTYQWQVDGPIDTFDKNVVLGLFPYGPAAGIGADGTNEIDIEYSRWGQANGPNGDWTDYPASGKTVGELSYSFSLAGATLSTSRFTWSSTSITDFLFAGLQPIDDATGALKTWTYAPQNPAVNIPQQPLPLGINLWCFSAPPSDGKPVEIVIRDFTFVPASAATGGTSSGGVGGAGGGHAGSPGGAAGSAGAAAAGNTGSGTAGGAATAGGGTSGQGGAPDGTSAKAGQGCSCGIGASGQRGQSAGIWLLFAGLATIRRSRRRWRFFLAALGLLGCHSGNEIICPPDLEACPATLPAEGAACSPRGSANLCEYGNDPWNGCNTVAYCQSPGGWHTVATLEPDCPSTLPSGCPASFAEATSSGQGACASAPSGQLTCRYPEGSCWCTTGGLTCTTPAAAGCPAARPYAGSACSAPCTTWGSGICDGESMTCVCGTWQPIQCTD